MLRGVVALIVAAGLSGCGTVVPSLRDWPDNATDAQNEQMVQAIVRSIHCELRNAVTDAVNADLDSAVVNRGKTYSDFLNNWGAEVLLTLTIKERSAINPNAIGMPPSPASAIFTISGGLSASSEATRIEKQNFFYAVRDLYLRKGEVCTVPPMDRPGSFLINNDLKIASILASKVNAIALGQASAPEAGKNNVLSHEVSFQVVTSGDITPSWKLVRATVNPSGPFFSANRDRTHDLLITFGPLDKARGGTSLIGIAEQTHFSSQLASGVTTGFRSVLP